MRASQYSGPERYSLDYGVETPRLLEGLANKDAPTMLAMGDFIESAHDTVAQNAERERRIDEARSVMADVALAEYSVPRPTGDQEG